MRKKAINNSNFSENLRFYRTKNEWSVQELGEKIQNVLQLEAAYARNTITDWENNRYEPPMAVIIALSQIFAITVDELILKHNECEEQK